MNIVSQLAGMHRVHNGFALCKDSCAYAAVAIRSIHGSYNCCCWSRASIVFYIFNPKWHRNGILCHFDRIRDWFVIGNAKIKVFTQFIFRSEKFKTGPDSELPNLINSTVLF